MQPSKFPLFLQRSSISTLDRSQTTCHCHLSRLSPHFTQKTAPFGIHFRVLCANVVFAWFEKCCCRFFCPAQIKQPLDQSPPRQRQNQWILKRWPPSKTVAQKRSVCWPAHPLNWLFARQALNAWLEMFPQAIFDQLFPSNSEKNIFDHFHNVAYPGRLAFRRIISSRFVWRGLSSDVTGLGPQVSGLPTGQSTTTRAWSPPPIPQWHFSHLHVDLVGPLQYSNNFNYIFTIIDRTSNWMEAISLSETSVVACAKALTFTWISLFGVPETITSYRGPQFNL